MLIRSIRRAPGVQTPAAALGITSSLALGTAAAAGKADGPHAHPQSLQTAQFRDQPAGSRLTPSWSGPAESLHALLAETTSRPGQHRPAIDCETRSPDPTWRFSRAPAGTTAKHR